MVAYAFNISTLEAKAGRPLISRPAWAKEQVPGGHGYTEKPHLKQNKKQNKQQKGNTLDGGDTCNHSTRKTENNS